MERLWGHFHLFCKSSFLEKSTGVGIITGLCLCLGGNGPLDTFPVCLASCLTVKQRLHNGRKPAPASWIRFALWKQIGKRPHRPRNTNRTWFKSSDSTDWWMILCPFGLVLSPGLWLTHEVSHRAVPCGDYLFVLHRGELWNPDGTM